MNAPHSLVMRVTESVYRRQDFGSQNMHARVEMRAGSLVRD